MSYLHLTRTRTRERSPSPPYRPLIRRDTKRSRIITLSDDSDDGHDDYPYSSTHRPVHTSRALTLRDQPSQLERYNIWSDRHKSEERDEDWSRERTRVYRHTSSRHHHHDDDSSDCLKSDPEEREFRLKVAASFSRPRTHSPPHHHHQHHSHHSHHLVPRDLFRRKEQYVDEGWESRERSRSRSRGRETARRDSFWGEGGFWGDEKKEDKESEDEKWSRYRRIKRTKTEEWSPLRGWRRV